MINFQDVTKAYPDFTVALDSLNLEIKKGEFLFLVGPSGAGKTTLIKLLIREEKPTSGDIYFKDLHVNTLPHGKLPQLRRQIGVVFQEFKLLPRKTIFENVALACEVVGKKENEIKQIVPHVLSLVKLEERQNAFPHNLSGGEKQRVAFARALAHEPEVLIADEPTGNIDIQSAWQAMELLQKINKWGTTVIVATHNVDIVDSLKKRVVALEKGKIIKDDPEGTY